MNFPYQTIVYWGERYTETNKQLVEAELARLTQQKKTDGRLARIQPACRNWATQEDAEAWKTYLNTLPDPPEDVKIELKASDLA